MSNINVASTWNVTLATEELRLVLKSLGGRLNDEETVEAKALGDKLTAQRVQATKDALRKAERTLEKIESSEVAA